jgi:hypothetical protein
MSKLAICPVCQSENSVLVVECQQCGAALEADRDITLPTIPSNWDPPVPHSHHAGHMWPPEGLALYVTGEDNPIEMPYRPRTVLGRGASSVGEPCVNLSDYGAGALGVSRRHATITFSGEDCLLEDLGSSNGTWLNGNRLTAYQPHPLQNGDVVRLGQLILFIYFEEERERDSA